MLVGYCRVSTYEQNPQLQMDALEKAGVAKIFIDKASGADRDRPELAKALAFCRKGDTLVVWKLDRAARSLTHLLQIAEELDYKGVAFKSLTETFETGTAVGKMIFGIMGALAEFERSLIRERTRAGIAAARQRGRVGGRKRVLSIEQAISAKAKKAIGVTGNDLANAYGVSRAALYRAMKYAENQ